MPLHPLVKEISRLTTRIVVLQMRRVKIEQEIQACETYRRRVVAQLTGDEQAKSAKAGPDFV